MILIMIVIYQSLKQNKIMTKKDMSEVCDKAEKLTIAECKKLGIKVYQSIEEDKDLR